MLCAGLLLIAAPLVWGMFGSGAKVAPVSGAAALPACTIFGTPAADVLVGTAGDDVICALGGDDRVRGRGGDDVLFGSAGDDSLAGGRGKDRLFGFSGANRLGGGAGRDFLQGGSGPDVFSGGPGSDLVDYRDRTSSLRVSIGSGANDGEQGEGDDVRGDVERVHGGSAADKLVGNARRNGLIGAAGDDALKGARGNDVMRGGAGQDRLEGRDDDSFSDALRCGPGEPDEALANAPDSVASDCEQVSQKKPPPVGGKNSPPRDILLSDNEVAEEQPVGTVVGTLDAVDADAGDSHTFALVNGPGSADNGSFTIAGDQLKTAAVFDFEVKSSYSIRVRVRDARGVAFQKALAITVTNVEENQAPTDVTLSPAAVAENQPIGTTVGSFAATDPNAGQSHTYALVAGAGDADNGAFTISGNELKTGAVFDYETKNSYSIRVRATDTGSPPMSFEKTFTVTVTDANDPPSADDTAISLAEDSGAAAIELSGDDADGDPLQFSIVSGPSHGSLGTIGSLSCSLATPNECTASVDYTPGPDFNGPDSFTYKVNDGTSDSAAATVSITVDPVNDTPVASPGSRTSDEDTPLTLDLAALVSDVETADADLTYEIVTPPAHGTATATTYTPDANFNGSDSFTYRVTDRGDPDNCSAAPCDASQTSTTETVSITVDPVNDAPQASPLTASVDEDGSLPVDLAALVSDVETSDANLTYDIVSAPAHGNLTGSGGARTYTPAADFNGSDSFTYRVTDRGDPDNCSAAPCDGPETSSTETVSITVNAVNDAPVNLLPAGPVSVLQETDTPLTGISIADVDAGSDDVELELSVEHGTLSVDTTVLAGVVLLQVAGNGTDTVTITASLAQINATLADADGLVYRGDTGYTGPDTLTVTTDDLGHNGAGGALTDTDTLALNVTPPNDAPVAAAQSVSTDEDTPKTITLSASDADGDDPLSFAIAGAPSHGSLGAIGAVSCNHLTPNVCTANVVYTPAANYNGPDSFTFTANDGITDSAAATVSITVDPGRRSVGRGR